MVLEQVVRSKDTFLAGTVAEGAFSSGLSDSTRLFRAFALCCALQFPKAEALSTVSNHLRGVNSATSM